LKLAKPFGFGKTILK